MIRITYVFLVHMTSLFPYQIIFHFHMSIVKHFRNTTVSALRNIHIIQNLCRVPPKRGFFEVISCLCVENVMHVLDPFSLQIKSRC